MNKKRMKYGLLLLCYSIVLAGLFYLVGYKTAYDRMEASASASVPQTFYATISEIRDNTVTVTGMEVNDVNFRGEFTFPVVEETKITWRHTDISMDDLDVGDHISITFTGGILESYPGQIQHVELIQLLDDENSSYGPSRVGRAAIFVSDRFRRIISRNWNIMAVTCTKGGDWHDSQDHLHQAEQAAAAAPAGRPGEGGLRPGAGGGGGHPPAAGGGAGWGDDI